MKKVYKYFRMLLRYRGTAADVIILLWRLMVRTVSSFSFHKLSIDANIGLDKPENLGYTVGAVEAAKGLLRNKPVLVKIKPSFGPESFLYGEMEVAARFHIHTFIKNMLMLCYEALWRKNIRKTVWDSTKWAFSKYVLKKKPVSK